MQEVRLQEVIGTTPGREEVVNVWNTFSRVESGTETENESGDRVENTEKNINTLKKDIDISVFSVSRFGLPASLYLLHPCSRLC